MGTGAVEKGSLPTGCDTIANYMAELGYSVTPIQNEWGHYLPAAIIDSISRMTIPQKSKSCKLQGWDSVWNETTYDSDHVAPKLTIGNLVIALPEDTNTIEGDVYIDINGNITAN